MYIAESDLFAEIKRTNKESYEKRMGVKVRLRERTTGNVKVTATTSVDF